MATTDREKLIQAVAVTAELLGTELSDAAAKVMVADLSAYPLQQVMGALQRCRREVRGKLTLADVLARLDDGRPGPEEAWAMLPKDEADSVVWSAEMRTAFRSAQPLLESGDEIAARMAFKETYTAEVTKARAERRDPAWQPSFGYNHGDRQDAIPGRKAALRDAVDRGRIGHERAQAWLPSYREDADEGGDTKQLTGPTTASEALEQIKLMRELAGTENAA